MSSLLDPTVYAIRSETRQCDVHGPYLSTSGYSKRWSRCPTCEAEWEAEKAQRHQQFLKDQAEQQAAAKLARRLNISGLEGRFLRATFDSYSAELPSQAKALQACREFAESFNADGGGGLWLIGPPGTGKTHLGSAVVSHVIREHQRTASIHAVHEIMRMLRERFGKKEGGAWEDDSETTDDLINRLGSQPLLVLDEIGVARDSEWQREQLFAIVDARYRLERPTIVISNLPAPELKAVLGDRVYDRLRENSRSVPMSWPSYRGSKP